MLSQIEQMALVLLGFCSSGFMVWWSCALNKKIEFKIRKMIICFNFSGGLVVLGFKIPYVVGFLKFFLMWSLFFAMVFYFVVAF